VGLLLRLHRAAVSRAFYPLALATVMVEVSYRFAHHLGYLRWDLALAWVPYLLSVALTAFFGRGAPSLVQLLRASPVIAFWLLFLPNAPYVVTDFVHLQPFAVLAFGPASAPWWWDLCFIASVAWTGWLLGMMSVCALHDLVERTLGACAGWSFALACLGLSAFGIFLGRFLRWNSWDVLVHPFGVLTQLATAAAEPAAHARGFAFTAVFAAFLVATYVPLATLVRKPFSPDMRPAGQPLRDSGPKGPL
jgi:uncharacterized membrane protein